MDSLGKLLSGLGAILVVGELIVWFAADKRSWLRIGKSKGL